MSYPGELSKCELGPAKGGLGIKDLRILANKMGIDTKGKKKAEICEEIRRLVGQPKKVAIKQVKYDKSPGIGMAYGLKGPISLTGLNFNEDIKRALDQVHPFYMQINEESMDFVNKFVIKLGNLLLRGGDTLPDLKKEVEKILPGELAKHGISEVDRMSVMDPSSLTYQHIPFKLDEEKERLNSFDSKYVLGLLGVLEYITVELLELSGNEASEEYDEASEDDEDDEDDEIIIRINNIRTAIRDDAELKELANKLHL